MFRMPLKGPTVFGPTVSVCGALYAWQLLEISIHLSKVPFCAWFFNFYLSWRMVSFPTPKWFCIFHLFRQKQYELSLQICFLAFGPIFVVFLLYFTFPFGQDSLSLFLCISNILHFAFIHEPPKEQAVKRNSCHVLVDKWIVQEV